MQRWAPPDAVSGGTVIPLPYSSLQTYITGTVATVVKVRGTVIRVTAANGVAAVIVTVANGVTAVIITVAVIVTVANGVTAVIITVQLR